MSVLTFNEQSANPSAPASGKVKVWADNTARPKLKHMDDASDIRYLLDDSNYPASVADQTGFAADTYLAGSSVLVAAGAWRAKSQYRLMLDMVKTAAGTATPIFTVRMGTAGTVSDASVLTITFGAGTAAADTGIFIIELTFRTVGSGTSAILQAVASCAHHLAATGLTSTGASGTGIILATSAGFDSTTQTVLGVSFNGGTSFAGTNKMVKSALIL